MFLLSNYFFFFDSSSSFFFFDLSSSFSSLIRLHLFDLSLTQHFLKCALKCVEVKITCEQGRQRFSFAGAGMGGRVGGPPADLQVH